MFKKIISLVLSILMIFSLYTTSFASLVDAEVKEYLVAPSQYTNSGFGQHIEATLTEKGGVCSLGNFGGYVIYKFNNKIYNSPDHKYGVDFTVTGNSFNGAYTTQEPGQVYVSQDGNVWYALAGSEHYEDETVWDYNITYYNNDDKICTYSDSLGENGNVPMSRYPDKTIYSDVVFGDASLSLSGILLRKERKGSPSNGILTSFGYVDTMASSTKSVSNPYVENPTKVGVEGQFDIDWAVDKNGMPVKLGWVKYVKVQTATFIDGAMFGEKSTEITSVDVVDEKSISEENTEAIIKLNGEKLFFENNICDISSKEVNSFNISVESKDSNVYINNERTNNKIFDVAPSKGLVRIIIQNNDSEPEIFIIQTEKSKPQDSLNLSHKNIDINRLDEFKLTADKDVNWYSDDDSIASVDENGIVYAVNEGSTYINAVTQSGKIAKCLVKVLPEKDVKTVNVTLTVSDGTIILPPTELSVKSGTAKAYGYSVASTDHNSKVINGVTLFDVIVAEHEVLYGEKFNRNTKDDYLIMNSSFITKSFGKSAASSGFTVNDTMPNDGIINELYNSLTGYACDTAVVEDGDMISYFFYQDSKYFSDVYSFFGESEYSATVGKTLTLELFGYGVMQYGLNNFDTIKDNYSQKLSNIDVYLYNENELILLGTTNKKGKLKVVFDEEGEYTLVAMSKNSEENPVIISWSKVNVNKKEKVTFVSVIKSILELPSKIFNFLFGWMTK